MLSKSPSINLLKNKEASLFGGFVNWAVTIGRIVVILVELVAFSAFIYRFSLDRKLVDLRTQIKQKQAILAPLEKNEEAYRNLQDTLSQAANLSSASIERYKILKEVLNLTPQGITLNNFSLSKNSLNISATAKSISYLNLFVNSLKNYPSMDTLNIGNIERKLSINLIVVGISATLKQSEYDKIQQ